MSVSLRVILFVVSFLVAVYVLRRIRKAKLKIEYSLFWIVFAFLLLVLSIFPQIAVFFAGLCGIQSPVNFIFLFMIFILLLHNFYLTFTVSHLENMIQNLTQEIAVRDALKKDESLVRGDHD